MSGSTTSQQTHQSSDWIAVTASIAPDLSSRASSNGTIGNTIIYPPGVPGSGGFAIGGAGSNLVNQVVVGALALLVLHLLSKHLKG